MPGIPSSCIRRLKKEMLSLRKDPVPLIQAVPLENNILEWHYCLVGSPGTPFQGGFYHGKVVFPPQYPFKPPAIYMITPNGRFSTNTKLCLSISDFHPETWSCLWSVATILQGVLSFMNDSERSYGTIDTSDEVKRKFAVKSIEFNLKNELFVRLFPEIAEDMKLIRQDPSLIHKMIYGKFNMDIGENDITQNDITLNQSQVTLKEQKSELVDKIAVMIALVAIFIGLYYYLR